MIPDNIGIICPRCGGNHSLSEWNDNTYKQCTSREMRRAYTNLDQEKAFYEKTNAFYMCPECKQWSRGCQLIIDSDDKRLVRLGHKPIIKYE